MKRCLGTCTSEGCCLEIMNTNSWKPAKSCPQIQLQPHPPTDFLNFLELQRYLSLLPNVSLQTRPVLPPMTGSLALTGWYRCQEPSGQMAGAKGEQTTRLHFFSHLLVGWADHCSTNRIRASSAHPPGAMWLQRAEQDYCHLKLTPNSQEIE